jgi:hypothetical protein
MPVKDRLFLSWRTPECREARRLDLNARPQLKEFDGG